MGGGSLSDWKVSIDVLRGWRVETRPDWFCETVRAGEFSSGNFDETDIVEATGGGNVAGPIVFVSSARLWTGCSTSWIHAVSGAPTRSGPDFLSLGP